ncbi:MAG: hypothetical protein F4151_12660 [Gammaproteobacteria bacterium]|nr:hypothetical protein [Gammaproteobacteria bacterium]
MDLAPTSGMTSVPAGPGLARGTARAANYRRSRVLCLAAILCLIVNCGDEVPAVLAPPPPPGLVATTVTLEPSSVTLDALGDTIRLAATVLNQNGDPMAGVPIAYTTTDASVVRVDGFGLVTAFGNGSAVVTAASGAATGVATVTVEQMVARVRVSPDSATLVAIGDTLRLEAEALDSQGRGVPGTHVFEWSSNDSVAAVDRDGLVTAVRNGSAVVTATTGTVSGEAAVNVEQAVAEVQVLPGWVTLFSVGTTAQLAARALDANGAEVPNMEFEWSNDRGAARVSATGLVTALREGTGVVTATTASVAGSAAVTVSLLAGAAKDRAILEAVYDATEGRFWRNNRNWLSDAPLGDWYGVDTDADGRVVGLDLVANNLEGHIPPELGRLDELRELLLDAATVPQTWCYRPSSPPESSARNGSGIGWSGSARGGESLHWLSWARRTDAGREHGAGLVTDIPMGAPLSFATGLRNGGNRLAGPIPPELGELANLETLSLDSNELSGSIPPELGKLANLKTLSLSRNRLTGTLPPELGNLIRLESLNLAVSYDLTLTPPRPRYVLSGRLPPQLGNLVRLKELDLRGHKFTGTVPSAFARLRALEYLSLTCNSLDGPVPSVVRQLRQLRHLDLSGNQFEGGIPAWLDDLDDLEFLDLASNYFLTGPIPTSVTRMTGLVRLSLGTNRLFGLIPPRLGRLTNLESLAVGNNLLTGALPPQLGDLPNLEYLSVFRNAGLTGALPRELMQVRLDDFNWQATGLCAPRDRVFQSWLESILNHQGGPGCTLPPREIFTAFFEATGGAGWTNNANWLRDAPVASWFGVTVEDSLLTALDLPDNGLSGTLPPAVGDFLDLKRLDLEGNALTSRLPPDLGNLLELEALDLSGNGFSGPVPRNLAQLGALERLDLSDNELGGALPGILTSLRSLSDFNWRNSGACAPEVAWFQTWLESVETRSGPTCDGIFSVSVAEAHLSQATQGVGGGVPLIAGRPGLVRVLATADRANDFRPSARAAFVVDGSEAHAADMALESSRGLAESLPGQLDQWYQAAIPAAALRPGVEMAVRIDPDSTMPRAALDEVRIPLDVRELPPLDLTIVPVVTGSSADADVREWVKDAEAPPVEFMRAVLPVGELNLTVREPLRIASAPDASKGAEWIVILEDIELVRKAEGGSGYWYGVVNRDGDQGIRGIALVEGRVGLGVPDAEVFAHELGHSMSLMHSPCGNPWQIDPDYPYPDGSIGVLGYDARSEELVDSSTHDLMSYCHPQWISDYNFRKALEYRLRAETSPRALAARDEPRGSRLLLRGYVSAEGELHLDPAFALDAPAQLPSGSGPYRVEGFSTDGIRAFALDFDMEMVSEGGGSFFFLLPFAEDRIAALERIVLSGPEGTATLDRETRASPVAIVTDRATGRIRSILRGEAAAAAGATVAADGRSRAVPRDRVLVSYGLPEPVP